MKDRAFIRNKFLLFLTPTGPSRAIFRKSTWSTCFIIIFFIHIDGFLKQNPQERNFFSLNKNFGYNRFMKIFKKGCTFFFVYLVASVLYNLKLSSFWKKSQFRLTLKLHIKKEIVPKNFCLWKITIANETQKV